LTLLPSIHGEEEGSPHRTGIAETKLHFTPPPQVTGTLWQNPFIQSVARTLRRFKFQIAISHGCKLWRPSYSGYQSQQEGSHTMVMELLSKQNVITRNQKPVLNCRTTNYTSPVQTPTSIYHSCSFLFSSMSIFFQSRYIITSQIKDLFR
jgi:hypothetical protein